MTASDDHIVIASEHQLYKIKPKQNRFGQLCLKQCRLFILNEIGTNSYRKLHGPRSINEKSHACLGIINNVL